jgi:hypothetical protein
MREVQQRKVGLDVHAALPTAMGSSANAPV